MVVLLKNTESEFFLQSCNRKGYDDLGQKTPEYGFRKHLFSIRNTWLPDGLKNRVPEVFFHTSVKTGLHKISHCETLVIRMMKLALRQV